MTPHPASVVVAGAGWRVWRFVVPALLNEGVTPEQITILRRSDAASSEPILAGLRAVTTIEELRGLDVRLTVNCVSAPSLVDVQTVLVRAWPRAVHFCDTPIYTERRDIPQVLRLSRARMYSLEDWPLMPNLAYLARQALCASGSLDARIEHFGIPGHFISLYRTMTRSLGIRRLELRHGNIAGELGPSRRITLRSPKRLHLAKALVRTDTDMVEDFHEAHREPIDDHEVMYRLLDARGVHYCRGLEILSTHLVDPALLSSFEPLSERQNAHELDKFVALTRLFRAALGGSPGLAYGYLRSARDTATVRRLNLKGATWLW